MQMQSKPIQPPYKIKIVGLLGDVTFQIAKCCAEDLHQRDPSLFPPPDITGMLEFDWDLYLDAKRKEQRGETWNFDEKAIYFVNDEPCGGPMNLFQWAESEHKYENFRPMPLYETLAEQAYKRYLNSRNHEYVYMDIAIDDKPVGRLLIELFSDSVPKTCENFKELCTGEKGESTGTEYKLHYKDSLIHRVQKNGWIQGGDIWMKRGDGGESIYGSVFEDENFDVKFTRRGIVGMANKGRHTNGSQFFITLNPAAWMNTKYVAFGQVIEGTETLKAIEEVDTMNQRPYKEVKIKDCGTKSFVF